MEISKKRKLALTIIGAFALISGVICIFNSERYPNIAFGKLYFVMLILLGVIAIGVLLGDRPDYQYDYIYSYDYEGNDEELEPDPDRIISYPFEDYEENDQSEDTEEVFDDSNH